MSETISHTGEELLFVASRRVQDIELVDYNLLAAISELLEAASKAFPIDFAEPPRNPRDMAVIYKALALARLIVP